MTHAPLLAPDTQVQRPGGVPGSHKDLCPGSRGQCSQHCLVTVRPLAWAAKERHGCSRGRAAGGGKPGLSSMECAVERRQAAKTGRMGGWGELPLHRGHLNLRTEPDRWQVWEAQGGACSGRAWGKWGVEGGRRRQGRSLGHRCAPLSPPGCCAGLRQEQSPAGAGQGDPQHQPRPMRGWGPGGHTPGSLPPPPQTHRLCRFFSAVFLPFSWLGLRPPPWPPEWPVCPAGSSGDALWAGLAVGPLFPWDFLLLKQLRKF